jgi:hypothetical protein
MHPSLARLSEFLVDAKRKTYAGLDDDATVSAPLLPSSKQLGYRAGDLSYRDIYFGMSSSSVRRRCRPALMSSGR